ncbi:MAG: ArsR/SmtB family transcription factor [Saccharofermentanales bacterium]
MKNIYESLYKIEKQADLLKVIAHPVRLCIVCGLLNEPDCNVSKIQGCLGMPQSTVSQHLAKLKSAGIIRGKRNGPEICYKVVNEEVIKIVKCLVDEPACISKGEKEGMT